MTVEAKLIAVTQPVLGTPAGNPEDLITFCARVSSGRDYWDRTKDSEGLLKYCIRNKHWSIFEMANAVVEVKGPRDITRQLLRHRSLHFQELSQRYASVSDFTDREYRAQDEKNRQNSLDVYDIKDTWEIQNHEQAALSAARIAYDAMIQKGVAKECARVVLPEGLTMSTLYVNGTLRSWIHYLEVRDDPGVTQKEHVDLAREIKECLLPAFPTVLGMV